jgi:methylmalonyl-CoA mutase cobalamin-binding subunit
MEAIRAMGIDGVFGPGTNTSDIVAFIQENAGPRSHAA